MTATVDPIPRRSLSKKRHTKPCKFFQTMQCPFSAEECDFAHVSVDACPPPLSMHKRKACRYFMSGHCTQGLWCRFRHGMEGSEEVKEKGDIKEHKVDHSGAKSKSASLTRLEISKYQGPHIQTHSPGFPPSPGYLSWAPYNVPLPGYPHESNCREDFQAKLTSPTATTNSSDSAAGICTPSESSSSMTDDVVVITTSPVNAFHPNSPEIPTSPFTPNTPVNPIFTPTTPVNTIPVYSPIVSPYLGDHNPWSPRSPSRSTRSQSHPRPSSSRQKTTYKTKSCKFFKPDSICPKGDQCTFVHDPNVMMITKAPTDCTVSPVQSDETKSGAVVNSPIESLESDSTPKLHHELPVKPLSLREENKKKGFYPISWRVIGGGVMIGGKGHPLPCPDTPTNADSVDDCVGLSQATSDMKLGEPNDPTPNKLSISVVSAVALPSTPEPPNPIDNLENVIPNRKATPRVRAMSIPPTPTSERMDILALFSAESPGGL